MFEDFVKTTIVEKSVCNNFHFVFAFPNNPIRSPISKKTVCDWTKLSESTVNVIQ